METALTNGANPTQRETRQPQAISLRHRLWLDRGAGWFCAIRLRALASRAQTLRPHWPRLMPQRPPTREAPRHKSTPHISRCNKRLLPWLQATQHASIALSDTWVNVAAQHQNAALMSTLLMFKAAGLGNARRNSTGRKPPSGHSWLGALRIWF